MVYTFSMKKNLKHIFVALLTALFFSAFIYFEYFGLTNKLVNSIFGLLSLYMLLHVSKKSVLFAGFFIGIFWFYWVGYSFKYTGVGYLSPFVTLGFGIIYMLFFGVLAFFNNPFLRATVLFALSFVELFNFNWLQIQAIFTDSYIGLHSWQLALILFVLAFNLKKFYFLPLLLLVFTLNINPPQPKKAPLNIKLVQTDIKQNLKWTPQELPKTIKLGFNEINKAIKQNYDVIVFPESFYPFYMNKHPKFLEKLLQLSKHITIITGSLYSQNHNHYNVSYILENGKYSIAKKFVLVPFGEYVPLPKFARDYINNTFFAGQADFKPAEKPTDFYIKGVKFRNAICYEATSKEIYKGDVKFVIAMSNNAWFAPSIEPTLQKILMRYYGRKNNVTIYHSANYKFSGVVK